MTARKNEIVGIVGESGCGKSTLLKLLLRFWERSGGQIRYNGTDLDEINTESLYRNVTMVSQSTYLFDATIAENLRVAKPDATDEELMAALRMASAEELVQALPEGLNTPAGLLGGRLSNVPDHIVARLKQREPERSVASWACLLYTSPSPRD